MPNSKERSNALKRLVILALSLMFVPCFRSLGWGDAGILQVLVHDAHKRPIKGVEIGIEGGGSGITGNDGMVLLRLPKDTVENDWASLQIIRSPIGKAFVMVSPYDSRTLVPSFKNKADNIVHVVVMESGDYSVLKDGTILEHLTSKINKLNALREMGAKKTEEKESAQADLAMVAKQYGLNTEDLDQAIRTWKTTGPYDTGLAALYEPNYPKATDNLTQALQSGEEILLKDQKAVADAAFFLGFSLWQEGRLPESIKAFRRSLQLRPDEPAVMAGLGLDLMFSGDHKGAETLFRQARAIDEKTSGSESLSAGNDIRDLAALFILDDRYSEAEELLQQSLAITEKLQDPASMAATAIAQNNLAAILEKSGDEAGAERLWREAVPVAERMAPDSWDLVAMLSSLALIKAHKGDHDQAEELFRHALAIAENKQNKNHGVFVVLMNNYGLFLKDKGDSVKAETYFCRALSYAERVFGPNAPYTRKIRDRLESVKGNPSHLAP